MKDDVNLYGLFQGCESTLDMLYDYALEHRLSTRMVDTIATEVHTQKRDEYVHLERSTYVEGLDYDAELCTFNRRLLEQYVLPELKREHLAMAAHGRPDLEFNVEALVDELDAEDDVEMNFSDLDPEELRRLEEIDER